MILANDLYAETNPAFCAFVLSSFCAGHEKSAGVGADVAVCYLTLPIVLSDELSETFLHTNSATGLSTWLDRSPQIRVGLAERVNLTLDFTTEALRFGCFVDLLRLTQHGSVLKGPVKRRSTMPEIAEFASKAQRLGQWFSGAGSARAVLSSFGLTA